MNRRLHFLFSFLMLLVFSAGLRAQGSPCLGSVNISVDTLCTVTITPATLQPPAGAGTTVIVKLSDWGISPAIVASVFPGATYNAAAGTVTDDSLKVVASAIPSFFNNGMIGPVKISVDQSGVPCWGYVMIEDKLPPKMTIPADVTVSCVYKPLNDYGNPAPGANTPLGIATSTGSCSKVNITYVDKTTTLACNPDSRVVKSILRIWTAINVKGAATIDTQLITVEALDVEELEGPTYLLEIPCQYKANRKPAELLGKPLIGGGYVDSADVYPYIVEGNVNSYLDKEAICNIGVTYTDIVVHACAPDCEASIKVLRTWTVFDWCTAEVAELSQIIKFVDNEAPEVVIGEPAKSYSVDAWECNTDIVLPAMSAVDNCDEHASVVKVTTDAPIVVTYSTSLKRWVAYDVPKGTHKFWVTAADCCGNYVIDSLEVVVVDKVAPVATAKEFIVVSLTRSGLEEGERAVAKIFPEHIDNGSYDNCGPVYLEIRREAGPACLNVGTSNYNNNLTYNGTVNGLDQTNPLHEKDDTKDTDKGQFVKFCCEDAGAEHKVWLRVWDDASMDGIYGNAGDNYNETWAIVKVEDNTVPIIVNEVDVTVYCDEDLSKLNLNLEVDAQGKPVKKLVDGKVDPSILPWVDAACDYDLYYTDKKISLTTCNTGEYLRTYYVYGGKGGVVEKTADQHIYINDVETEPYHDLPYPLHLWNSCTLTEDDVRANTKAAAYTYRDTNNALKTALYKMPYYWGIHDDGYNSPNLGDACWNYDYLAYPHEPGLPYEYQYVTQLVDGGKFDLDWKDIGCRVFGKKIIIDEYEVGEGCKKWLVRFEYIDWCNPYWSYCLNTIYKYEDTTPPVIEACPDLTIEVDQATCLGTATVAISATDDGGCLQGYTWTVTVNDVTKTARGPKFSADFTGLPAGEHKVYVKVTDGCGNVAECVGNISVWPKDPTPYCIPLSSAVMKNGKVELWAIDFDKGSFTNCGSGLILFTFDNEYPVASKIYDQHYFKGAGLNATKDEYEAGNAQLWKPVVESTVWPNGDVIKTLKHGSSSAKIFGCAVGDLIGTNEVIMSIYDYRYKDFSVNEYCKTSLVLSNSQGDSACGGSGSASVTGRVATSVGEGVSGVEAQLSASLPEFPIMAVSAEGSFAFNNVPAGVEYEVSAKKDIEYKNGVNTLDLLRIQRHILSMTKLDNAYKFVAADANNDQNIDVNDLVDLRKLVLGVINDLPRNQSWRFVDASQTFSDINNPWPLNEVVVAQAGQAANFVAIKVGDIDINAAVSATSKTNTRSAETVTFNINERAVKAGEVVEIPVTATNFNEVFGYQFTTELNGLTVEAVESGSISVDESMYANLGGKFTMSWTDVNGATVSNDAVLFTLKVKATSNTKLSEAIAMTSSVTEAEAYVGADFATADAKLNVRGAEATGYALAQNEPNPFKAETVVRFSVPEATQVSFRVYDVTGKVLMNRFINAAKGDNAITLRKADLNASGIVYYQIESGDFTATKKMVIIE